MARTRIPPAGLALVLLASACGSAPPPSIVLVSIDSLRADRLGCYGADRDTSPAIDALAAEGSRFENAIAPTSWTLPSHVTLLTGLSIPAHRVDRPERRIDPARQLLASHLRAQGFRTAAFVSAPFLHRAYGFDRGFELYRNFQSGSSTKLPTDRSVHEESHKDETAPQVVDAALEWLAERPVGGEPWFLFVHLWDVHYDFVPPAPYDRMFDPEYQGDLDPRGFERNPRIARDMPARDLAYLRALYDGEIRWLDHHLGRLFEAIRERESDERVIVSLVADHGEEFFEHGMKGHMKNLHEESVRVPWIVRAPGRVPADAVVPGVVGLQDVAPTLLGLAGQPPLREATGRDLTALLRGGAAPSDPVLLNLSQVIGLRGSGWKVVLDTRTRQAAYFDLGTDPGEQRPKPARAVAPDKVRLLLSQLRSEQARAQGLAWQGSDGVALDPGTEAKLRALGYLGDAEPAD